MSFQHEDKQQQLDLENQKIGLDIEEDDQMKTEKQVLKQIIIGQEEVYNKGNCIIFGVVNERPIFVLGPHFPCFFVAQTIFLSLGIYVSMNNEKNKGICYFATFCQFFLYTGASILNPGICYKKQQDQLNQTQEFQGQVQQESICRICQVVKKKNRVHCKDCDICIDGHDHHCPWVGKCIGKDNSIFFFSFLISTVVYFVVIMTNIN